MPIATRTSFRAGSRAGRRPLVGFTLTELLVAIAILAVVIVAVARIFGTVSTVTGTGAANADILQTAQTIEKQIRADIARLSRDGFIAIQSVAVRNNVNGAGAPLLNSSLPPNAFVRADRIVFIAQGEQESTVYAGSDDKIGSGTDTYWPNKQATASRVYLGHGVQLRNARPGTDPLLAGMENGQPVLPWTFDPPGASDGGVTMVNWNTGSPIGAPILASQPSAREWILARQVLLLADDGSNGFFRYNNRLADPKNSTVGIWALPTSPAGVASFDSGPLASRVDIAASTLDKVRQTITGFGANTFAQQQTQILRSINVIPAGTIVLPESLRYPRAEKIPPGGSTDRIDQMLTNPALAFGCSSFAIDWTWSDGVGRVSNADGSTVDPSSASPSSGDEWVGFVVTNTGEQPWFGLPDPARGVFPLLTVPTYTGAANPSAVALVGLPIYSNNIELPVAQTGGGELQVYHAVFGLNQTRPVALDATTNTLQPAPGLGYTPWPTSLRFTFTLHDSDQRFPEGRTFQFVVELPRR